MLGRAGGDREMADILALVLLHDEQLVEKAVTLALEAGQASKQHVLNCLHRLQDGPEPRPLHPPSVLQLITEPIANPQRYDELREVKA